MDFHYKRSRVLGKNSYSQYRNRQFKIKKSFEEDPKIPTDIAEKRYLIVSSSRVGGASIERQLIDSAKLIPINQQIFEKSISLLSSLSEEREGEILSEFIDLSDIEEEVDLSAEQKPIVQERILQKSLKERVMGRKSNRREERYSQLLSQEESQRTSKSTKGSKPKNGKDDSWERRYGYDAVGGLAEMMTKKMNEKLTSQETIKTSKYDPKERSDHVSRTDKRPVDHIRGEVGQGAIPKNSKPIHSQSENANDNLKSSMTEVLKEDKGASSRKDKKLIEPRRTNTS